MRHRVALKDGADLAGFRQAARRLIAAAIPPRDVVWTTGAAPSLFGAEAPSPIAPPDAPSIAPPVAPPIAPPVALPRAVADLIGLVVCHRDPERYALLYTLIWRLRHNEPALFQVHSDPLVHRLHMRAKAIRRDLHKMHAFLRFRPVADAVADAVGDQAADERFVAWFEPDHFILEATADFFVDRFRSMAWSILTPLGSLHWDRARLTLGPPGARGDAPAADALEAGWCGYYASIFNPARVNPTAMRAEMAKKYWRNLPEAAAIPALIRAAPARTQAMIETPAAAPAKRNPDKAVAAMRRHQRRD